MRGAFAIVLLSLVGAVGCGDAAADIQATQHGKRLNLVAGEESNGRLSENLALATLDQNISEKAPAASGLYRDVAGVVLTDSKYGAQHLEQWILSQDGAAVRTRTCPVKDVGGVDFGDCGSWRGPQQVADLGLAGFAPVRSFSSYLFTDAAQHQELAQVVFNLTGDERQERICPVVGSAINWPSCSNWLAQAESVSELGAPQQTAFDDEVVVPYFDKQGNPQFTQQLITPLGDSVWARSCATSPGEITGISDNCAFSPPVRLSALGIHFEAVQGVGGYTYSDGGAQIYAQTVIAADGISASRRLCPVTSEGVSFESCLGWESVDLAELARHGSTL